MDDESIVTCVANNGCICQVHLPHHPFDRLTIAPCSLSLCCEMLMSSLVDVDEDEDGDEHEDEDGDVGELIESAFINTMDG